MRRSSKSAYPCRAHLRKTLLLTSLVALLGAAPAAAHQVNLHVYNGTYPAGSFTGSDAVGAGPFISGVEKIDVDGQTGTVYVGVSSSGHIYRFDASGVSQPFSALSPNTVIGQPFDTCCSDLEVDNSTNAGTHGRFYAAPERGNVKGWLSSGASLEAPYPAGGIGGFSDNCGIAIGPTGNIWVADYNQGLKEFSPDGVATGTVIHPNPENMCEFDMDPQGNFYVPTPYTGGPVKKYSSTGEDLGTIDSGPSLGVGIDTSNGDIYVDDGNHVNHYSSSGGLIGSFGEADASRSYPGMAGSHGIAVNPTTHEVYVGSGNRVDTFVPTGPLTVPDVTTGDSDGATRTTATLNGTVNPDGVDTSDCHFEYGTSTAYGSTAPCAEGNVLSGSSDQAVSAALSNLQAGTVYHFRLVAANDAGGPPTFGADQTLTTVPAVKEVVTGPASDIGLTSATLNGSFDPNNDDTHYYFEYGTSTSYGLTTATPPGVGAGSTPGNLAVSAEISALQPGVIYHFRLVASNEVGTTLGEDRTFTPSAMPAVEDAYASNLNTDAALIHVRINPNGAETTYHFEYGAEDCGGGSCTTSPDVDAGGGVFPQSYTFQLSGLESGTTYHYRVVAANSRGTSLGDDHSFTTFSPPSGIDSCGNAHVRQQTGAALLLDCRAYELVSSADTGGYDVESDLAPGQTPFGGYPRASDRVLYGVHSGAIPGPWNPTNHGVDPYVAARGEDGWSTDYVGLSADNPNASGPFSSRLAEADPALDSFAFGGPGICTPCFSDGSTNMPLRLSDGKLVAGMAGSLDHPADAAGHVARHFSADGAHFIFATTAQLEQAANSNGTDATVYERDLRAGTTQVVSTLPDGSTIAAGDGVAELDVSGDGSRVVIGMPLSTDAAGNLLYHLYMHVSGTPDSIDLTPGTTSGALYDGISADGSSVYFTTPDALPTAADQDNDASGDIYRADVGNSSATLIRVSTGSGGAGNSDSCDPPGDSRNAHWNTASVIADCSALAIAGGGGVASASGDIYFLSPERLDTSNPERQPVQDAPNLYVATKGEGPRYVATLESGADGPNRPLTRYTEAGSFGSFSNGTGIGIAPNGDIWVMDISASPPAVERFSPSGTLLDTITDGFHGLVGGNADTPFDAPSELAVDPQNGEVDLLDSWFRRLRIYDDAGTRISDLSPGGLTPNAVAINPTNHNIYTGDLFPQYGNLEIFTPTGTSVGTFKPILYPRAIAVDSMGRIYVGNMSETALYDPNGNLIRTVSRGPTTGLAVDPADDSIFIDQGDRILHLTAEGEPAGTVEVGGMTAGRSMAVSPGGRLYVIEGGAGGKVRWFDAEPAPDPRTDNPAVIHGVNDAATRHTDDFQITPDGDFAAFSSTLPLTADFTNRRHSEIYRYDTQADGLACVSCPPTGGAPSTDAFLSDDGLNLTDDGRVFFTSSEPLVLRDGNGNRDAYEWNDGTVQLISTGSSPFDSSLLSASGDGTDVFFFTKDTLVPQDNNGTLVKIYDARVEGGFPFIPERVPCKASDECHGPGTQQPGPIGINTITGTLGNERESRAERCGRGFVRRHGRCIHRHRQRHRRRHRRDRKRAAQRGGKRHG